MRSFSYNSCCNFFLQYLYCGFWLEFCLPFYSWPAVITAVGMYAVEGKEIKNLFSSFSPKAVQNEISMTLLFKTSRSDSSLDVPLKGAGAKIRTKTGDESGRIQHHLLKHTVLSIAS